MATRSGPQGPLVLAAEAVSTLPNGWPADGRAAAPTTAERSGRRQATTAAPLSPTASTGWLTPPPTSTVLVAPQSPPAGRKRTSTAVGGVKSAHATVASPCRSTATTGLETSSPAVDR